MIENGRPPGGKFVSKLLAAVNAHTSVAVSTDYRKSGSSDSGSRAHDSSLLGEMVQPQYSPQTVPTRHDLEAYLKEYLDLAECVPGAIAHAYIEITEALPLERIRRRMASA